ncbi:MAG: hypothetical protein FWD83_05610, partial [Promicromonosporaceae bacterium]|nr:hypothetical protein [Promicromonosporaceae bacterium]
MAVGELPAVVPLHCYTSAINVIVMVPAKQGCIIDRRLPIMFGPVFNGVVNFAAGRWFVASGVGTVLVAGDYCFAEVAFDGSC